MDDLIEQINDDWNTNREKADASFWKEIDSCAAFCGDIDENTELSADILGIQNIKFDSETPYDNAINYKNEGNYYYQKKNYILAISNYRKALSLALDDNDLNSILITNIAACQFYKENYRMCIDSCKQAIKLNRTYMKPYWRAAAAAHKVNKFEEGISFCDGGLLICPDNRDLIALKDKLCASKRKEDESKMCLVSRPLMIIEDLLKARGVVIDERNPEVEIPRQHLSQPTVDHDGLLHLNMLLLYPEYSQTDFLQDVLETASVRDCLSTIFAASEKTVDWDLHGHYRLYGSDMRPALRAFYRDGRGDMVEVAAKTTVTDLLVAPGYRMRSDLVVEVSIVSSLSRDFVHAWTKEAAPLALD